MIREAYTKAGLTGRLRTFDQMQLRASVQHASEFVSRSSTIRCGGKEMPASKALTKMLVSMTRRTRQPRAKNAGWRYAATASSIIAPTSPDGRSANLPRVSAIV